MARICGAPLFIALSLAILSSSQSEEQQTKIRQKREWIVPPRNLRENKDYTKWDYIAKIRSDEETRTSIQYSLRGPGADEPPINLFTVDRHLGLVKIHGLLDREQTPVYHLQGEARFLDGSFAERNIDLRIVVLDENDCVPVFNLSVGSVFELSTTDTYVLTVTATDADEKGSPNSEIAYSFTDQSQDQMFRISKEGLVYVRKNTLDREKKDKYTLTVKGTDMNGAPGGNTATGTVIIHILDENDNVPTLEKNIYECSVEENTKHVEVVRIPAFDADLIHTDNWLVVFTIVSGNEAGYFSITTDNKTNEGILIIYKELDYEELKEVSLVVSVSNKAPYHSSVVLTQSQTYTIRVRVINQPEGPRFRPAVKVITISEESSTTINKVITNYAAVDSDTLLIATNVRYAKIKDVDNWLTIDEKTADIRLNKIPDYESKFLINGTYYAEIISITNDAPAKTATGTIAIQVKDFNDHCPELIHQSQILCYEEHVVYVTAVDKDQYPNAEPFDFKVDSRNTKELWNIEKHNGTTAIFRSQKTLWPGVYHLFVDVKDQQEKICAGQELLVEVCTCDESKVCLPKKRTFRFGASGVLLMLLGLLLLLLVPLLLLFCLCGGAGIGGDFKTIPFDAKEHLITYNTEGQGEDKGMALLPITKIRNVNKPGNMNSFVGAQHKANGQREEALHWSNFSRYDQLDHHHQGYLTDWEIMDAQRKDEYSRYQDFGMYDGLALSDAFLGNYYSQKTRHVAKKHDMGDSVRVYEYEGQESHRGSFEDICGLLHEDENLAFLDDLDLRFKTLAEICSGSTIEREISTTIPVTSKPVQTSTHKDISAQETVLLQSQEKEESSVTILAAGAQQSNITSLTGMHVHEQVMVPNTTLLVQQPALYYAPTTPVYVMEPQSTLLVTPGQVLGIQENMLVEEQMSSSAALRGTAKRGAAKHETQHYQSVVLVEKQPTQGSVQAQSSVSGAVKIVNTEVRQSTETHGVRRAVHPARRVMTGEAREREVGFLDIRDPL